MNSYYEIQDMYHKFQVVQTHEPGRQLYTLLNSENKECITIVCEDNNPNAHLSMVKRHRACALDGYLEQGSQTVSMIKAFLRFVSSQVNIERIDFYDISTFDCNFESDVNEDSYVVPLSLTLHNLIIYGKTWYERNFGAIVNDNEIRMKIDKSVRNFISVVQKNKYYKSVRKILEYAHNQCESQRFQTLLQFAISQLEASVGNKNWMAYFYDLFSSKGAVATQFPEKEYACSLYHLLDTPIMALFKIPYEYESFPMYIPVSAIQSYPPLKTQRRNATPRHVKKWGGSRYTTPYISLMHFYTKKSLKRKRHKIDTKIE